MTHDPQSFLAQWFEEVWNKNTDGAIDELMAPDGIAYDFPVTGESVDREGFKAAVKTFQAAFSGIQVTVEDSLADVEKACVRWVATMTHTGDALGFAATGETIQITGINMVELRDGQIVKGWNAMDLSGPFASLRAIAEKNAAV